MQHQEQRAYPSVMLAYPKHLSRCIWGGFKSLPLPLKMLPCPRVCSGRQLGVALDFRVTEQDVKRKYIDLLQEYTSNDKLTAIEQLFTILQVATLGPTHQFAFGSSFGPQRLCNPPLSMLGRRNRVFSFCLWHMKLTSPFNLALPRMIIFKTLTSYSIALFLDFLLCGAALAQCHDYVPSNYSD